MAGVVDRGSDLDAPMTFASEDEQADHKNTLEGNEGWADVFAKVLTQNPKLKKSKKSIVLLKARKDAEIQRRRELAEAEKAKPQKRRREKPIEIVDSKGNVVEDLEVSEEEAASSSDDEDEKKSDALKNQRRKEKRLSYGNVQPQPGDPYEKNLLRTATKGVVQLFNAVNEHQERLRAKQKADSSDEEDRRYKKGQFMDTLYKIEQKKKSKEESKWAALKDDFMMNSKMRDWDKQNDSDDD